MEGQPGKFKEQTSSRKCVRPLLNKCMCTVKLRECNCLILRWQTTTNVKLPEKSASKELIFSSKKACVSCVSHTVLNEFPDQIALKFQKFLLLPLFTWRYHAQLHWDLYHFAVIVFTVCFQKLSIIWILQEFLRCPNGPPARDPDAEEDWGYCSQPCGGGLQTKLKCTLVVFNQ